MKNTTKRKPPKKQRNTRPMGEHVNVTINLYQSIPRDQLTLWFLENSGQGNPNRAAKEMLYDHALDRAREMASSLYGVTGPQLNFKTPTELLDLFTHNAVPVSHTVKQIEGPKNEISSKLETITATVPPPTKLNDW